MWFSPARSSAPFLGLFASVWLAGLPALASAPVAVYESKSYGYAVALPQGCRQDEGPGTVDAVCSPDLDAEKSASAPAAHSLVLGVTAERVAADAGLSDEALAQSFKESDFRDELPDAVCGVPDKDRVKLDDVTNRRDGGRVTYSASVTCPEQKFMGLGERRAIVRYVIAPGMRYRLMARVPASQFDQSKALIDEFLASFKTVTQSN